jgi:hypothetical protein
MSVHQSPKSPYWQYDFQIKGRRYCGSTKTWSKPEAEAIERQERVLAKRGLWDKAHPRKPRVSQHPKLYVVHAKGSTRFKLGISRNVKARMSDLQVGSSVPLDLITTTKIESVEEERRAHRVLAQWRCHGEWFDLGAGSDDFLQEIRDVSDDLHSLLAVLGVAQFVAEEPIRPGSGFFLGIGSLPS